MYRYLDLISATLRHSLMPHLLIASGLLLLLLGNIFIAMFF